MDSPSKDVFQHVHVPDDLAVQFTCDICKNPLLDAEIVIPCGHSFCGFCVEKLRASASASSCQLCRQPVSTFCTNRKANNMLSTIEGLCRWCGTKFPLDTARKHVRQCQEIEIKCSDCKQQVRRADNNHSEVCSHQEIICDCGEKVMRGILPEHKQTTCPMKERICPLQCGELVKWCLMPSHSLICKKVTVTCPVVGCGQHFRREEEETHLRKQQERHFLLLRRERSRVLWRANRGQLCIAPVRTNEKATMKWRIGAFLPANRNSPLYSPVWKKFERKWKMSFHDGIVRLTFLQGLDQIAVVVSFLVLSRDGKKHAYRDVLPTYILLEEGDFTEVDTSCKDPPDSVIVKIEVTEPSYQ